MPCGLDTVGDTGVVSKLPAGGGAVSRQNLSKFNLEETLGCPVVACSVVVSIVVASTVVVVGGIVVVACTCAVVSAASSALTVSDAVDWIIAALGVGVSVTAFGAIALQHAGAAGMNFLVGQMASFLNMSVSQTLFS